MDTRPLHYQSLLETSRALRAGETSSRAVTEVLLARISDLDGRFKSYIQVTREHALAQADAADTALAQGRSRGPLHGVPIAVKDLCCTTFAPTMAGMPVNDGFMSDHNATVVDRLETAGAVILGKLSMTEGAYTSHHPSIPTPLNPLNPDYWVGSSSTGSGTATSAGFCYASLGSDTGGSIRFPCATCGLTGLKPTWGRVSRHGVFDLAPSLDHVGPMARSAADCAAVLQAIAGYDPRDPTSLDAPVPDYMASLSDGVRDIRIGIDPAYALHGVDAPVKAAMEAAIDTFERLGARIVDVTMPPYEDLVAAWIMMCSVETAHVHTDTYPARAGEYGPDLVQLIEEGLATRGVDVARGHILRLEFSQALEAMLAGVDVMLCPTMPTGTPSLAQMETYGEEPEVLNAILRYTAPFDFSGSPTLTLPNGVSDDGMPTSMQIVGPLLSEALLLRAGVAYQSATGWHCMHPDLE
ncbi:amidase [Lutimaribacter marinistellae]|uniref:Amidase n=1 Tax=Lutimaribacter marinistellae TaxID=1820329 RepID=A0ABV7TGV5_9RHOB